MGDAHVIISSVLRLDLYQAQTTGETISTRVDAAAKTVTNLGVGVEHEVSQRTTLYGAVTTDFSYKLVFGLAAHL